MSQGSKPAEAAAIGLVWAASWWKMEELHLESRERESAMSLLTPGT